MHFGRMCAPATFQKGMMKIFADYLDKFMKVLLDDFTVYGAKKNHIGSGFKVLGVGFRV